MRNQKNIFPDDAPAAEECRENTESNQTEPVRSTSIIDALDHVQEEAHFSRLSEEFYSRCSADLDFLSESLELTRNQVIILAAMSELGEAVSWRAIANFFKLSRLKAMAFTPDFEGLAEKRWVYKCSSLEHGARFEAYKLVYGVINALRHNRKFEPENIAGLSEQEFVDRLTRYMNRAGNSSDILPEDNIRRMFQLVENNMHLPICRKLSDLSDSDSKIMFLALVADYAQFAGMDNEGLHLPDFGKWVDFDCYPDFILDQLEEGNHELFEKGLIEHGCEDGMMVTDLFRVSAEAKKELLGEFHPHRRTRMRGEEEESGLLKHTSINEKTLYYNENERRQISRLKSLLSREGLQNVQDRLAESGLRRGITCLFYGSPGTGKTESVLQLARECGRDIMQVDIAGLRDKFVGESEKNIKSVFNRYRSMCGDSDKTPILFFNEADAIINSRFETTRSSVEKMDNAIQNIILQEMESLDGILIATTNLTGTLDKAFDRRFLFKVEFSKPDLEAKTAIWHSMLPDISETDCRSLAGEFDFSGGQIENVARKCKIEFAISGMMPALTEIRDFCNDEHINRANRSRIGF